MNIDEILTKVQFSSEHTPVMVREVLESFSSLEGRSAPRYFDGTFGRGGHFKTMLAAFPDLEAVVMDQDTDAIAVAKKEFSTLVEEKRLRVLHGNFSLFSETDVGQFDMMLLDLGVSSPQFDQADRGFSFNHDGPLDMRMNRDSVTTAELILNTASEEQLNHIFQEYGEVRRPFRVTRAVVHDRKTKAFKSTRELAGLIERVDGWRQKGFHPATQYFMALRLAVNSELEVLRETLPKMMAALKPGGRLSVITFHSLEDRIVKNIFRDETALGMPVHKKVIVPTDEECEKNSRARSAKLRVFERGLSKPQKYRKGVQDELGSHSVS